MGPKQAAFRIVPETCGDVDKAFDSLESDLEYMAARAHQYDDMGDFAADMLRTFSKAVERVREVERDKRDRLRSALIDALAVQETLADERDALQRECDNLAEKIYNLTH